MVKPATRLILLVGLCFAASSVSAGSWRAGTAEVVITPQHALWMAGYAARTKPSEGVALDLYAKALVLEDGEGNRAALVTLDLLGFPAQWTDGVAEEIGKATGLRREQVLFNASHTHSGPALGDVLEVAYPMTDARRADVRAYTLGLAEKLVGLVKAAVADMEICKVSAGSTEVPFAVNRRVPTVGGHVIGANRLGPVDHRVPFLVVDTDRGAMKAVVFGYSCHNTTLGAENYLFHGDYAGVAQAWLEARYPGALALFVNGASGDANPYPRGSLELVEEHGMQLAKALDCAVTGPLVPVSATLKTAFEREILKFQEPPTRAELEARLQEDDVYRKKHAQLLLRRLEETGEISRDYPYPIQVFQLGDRVTLVALGGEVVGDYARRLRRETNDPDLWLAGYSNDVTSYIPSARVLSEGGYEPEESTIYYGQPAPFDPSIEERIVGKVVQMCGVLKDRGGRK